MTSDIKMSFTFKVTLVQWLLEQNAFLTSLSAEKLGVKSIQLIQHYFLIAAMELTIIDTIKHVRGVSEKGMV